MQISGPKLSPVWIWIRKHPYRDPFLIVTMEKPFFLVCNIDQVVHHPQDILHILMSMTPLSALTFIKLVTLKSLLYPSGKKEHSNITYHQPCRKHPKFPFRPPETTFGKTIFSSFMWLEVYVVLCLIDNWSISCFAPQIHFGVKKLGRVLLDTIFPPKVFFL